MQKQSLPTSRPMPSHSPRSSHSGTKIPCPNPLFYFPYDSGFLVDLDLLRYGILLVPVWVSCHSFVHYKLFAHLSLFAGGRGKQSEKMRKF